MTALPTARPNITESLVRALVLYSLAEFQLGHVTSIWIEARGHSFGVEDDGRGHAIGRDVDGSPYLSFIYHHLDYPFGTGQGKPIQLQGIGLSLLNRLCENLTVRVRKPTATLHMLFQRGQLVRHEMGDFDEGHGGNTIRGEVSPAIEPRPVDEQVLRTWLHEVLTASAPLRLHFNDQALSAPTAGEA